jgi:uncharacterized protein
LTTFVDSSVLFAAARARDGKHKRALEILGSLKGHAPVTTDHIVVETWLLLNRRYGHSDAMTFWRGIPTTPLGVETTTQIDLERARGIAQVWEDQEFSIVDCTSFVVMERLGIRRVATFDDDFAIYRYGRDRTKAFEVLR